MLNRVVLYVQSFKKIEVSFTVPRFEITEI